MSATCKYTERLTLIPGKSTHKTADWAGKILDRLNIGNYGIPQAIISDRDPKLLSDLWDTLFKIPGVDLLYAYHLQTDGMRERTNQTAEFALLFYMHSLEKH